MSANTNRQIADFIALFRDVWAECEALRSKERIEASGHSANWEECLTSARSQAEELFHPIFLALERRAPLPPILEEVRKRLEASRTPGANSHAASLLTL
jgi:hypothetical protein